MFIALVSGRESELQYATRWTTLLWSICHPICVDTWDNGTVHHWLKAPMRGVTRVGRSLRSQCSHWLHYDWSNILLDLAINYAARSDLLTGIYVVNLRPFYIPKNILETCANNLLESYFDIETSYRRSEHLLLSILTNNIPYFLYPRYLSSLPTLIDVNPC